jgi:hypothetical protein
MGIIGEALALEVEIRTRKSILNLLWRWLKVSEADVNA